MQQFTKAIFIFQIILHIICVKIKRKKTGESLEHIYERKIKKIKFRPVTIIVMRMNGGCQPRAVFYKENFSAYYICNKEKPRERQIFLTQKNVYMIYTKNKNQEEKSYEKRNYNNYSSRGCNNRKY